MISRAELSGFGSAGLVHLQDVHHITINLRANELIDHSESSEAMSHHKYSINSVNKGPIGSKFRHRATDEGFYWRCGSLHPAIMCCPHDNEGIFIYL